MVFDTHLHTEMSFDSDEKLVNVLQMAKSRNLGAITTEHLDLNHMEIEGFPIDFDQDEYFRRYGQHRSETYLLGIELGLDKDYTKEIEKIQKSHDFDMVIGSLHTMGKDSLSSGKYFRGKGYKAFYTGYLAYAREMVLDNPFIDALAHLDYPTRYSGYPNMKYEEFQSEFDGLFKAMIEHGVALELNLKRPLLGDVLASFRSIFTGYRDNGGEFVTLASDAHIAEDLGRNFDDALRLIDDIGLKICYYRNRERMLCSR